jgi:hypothetical protein
VQDPRSDHGNDQIELGLGVRTNDTIKAQFPESAQHSGDMAVRKTAQDLEGLIGRDEFFTA